jgi:hypothetical protein
MPSPPRVKPCTFLRPLASIMPLAVAAPGAMGVVAVGAPTAGGLIAPAAAGGVVAVAPPEPMVFTGADGVAGEVAGGSVTARAGGRAIDRPTGRSRQRGRGSRRGGRRTDGSAADQRRCASLRTRPAGKGHTSDGRTSSSHESQCHQRTLHGSPPRRVRGLLPEQRANARFGWRVAVSLHGFDTLGLRRASVGSNKTRKRPWRCACTTTSS